MGSIRATGGILHDINGGRALRLWGERTRTRTRTRTCTRACCGTWKRHVQVMLWTASMLQPLSVVALYTGI